MPGVCLSATFHLLSFLSFFLSLVSADTPIPGISAVFADFLMLPLPLQNAQIRVILL